MFKSAIVIIALFFNICAANAQERKLHIAVASNFVTTLEKISNNFSKSSGYKIMLTKGSTGTLYTQILQGAPFDVFLSADSKHAKKLENENSAVKESRFTYAIGTLAFWYPDSEQKVSQDSLFDSNIKNIAIANPKLAPYCQAAKEVATHWRIWQEKQPILLTANNVSQTFWFTQYKKNIAGFVSLSQLLKQNISDEKYWIVPSRYHSLIKQQAIRLNNKVEAKEFMDFLKSDVAKDIIIADGYKLEEGA